MSSPPSRTPLHHTRSILILCFFLLLDTKAQIPEPAVDHIDPDNPPRGIITDDWMQVTMQGKKIGYVHQRMERIEDEIHSSLFQLMRINRFGTTMKIQLNQFARETLDGQPIAQTTEYKIPPSSIQTRAVVKEDKLKVTITRGEKKTNKEIMIGDSLRFVWGMWRESLKKGFDKGTRYQHALYSPELSPTSLIETEHVVRGQEVKKLHGHKQKLHHIKSKMQVGPTAIVMHSWTNNSGRPLLMKSKMGGLPLKIKITTKEKALSDFEPPDVIERTLVYLNQALPKEASKATYILNFPENHPPQSLPNSYNQTVTLEEKGRTTLQVRSTQPPTNLTKTKRKPKGTEEIKDDRYLKKQGILSLTSQQFKKQLKAAKIKSNETAYKKAKSLTAYVAEYIEDKNFDMGFGSAAEVAKYRQGDCTEHAVMLAALGRAANIPTRAAAGLAYLPSHQNHRNLMGYHMWTQFYIDGQWMDFDAALHDHRERPARIALATSPLNEGIDGGLSLKLWNLIGQLDVELESAN